MPSAGKLFIYREDLTFPQILEKLEGWEESIPGDGSHDYDLSRRVKDVIEVDGLEGIYQEDSVFTNLYRGALKITPITVTAAFRFFKVKDEPYLIVLAGKKVANNVANQLSIALHDEQGAIVEPVLNIKEMKELYQSGEALKIALFDNIILPNIDKATIYGANVIQTDMYGRFINDGDPWYVVYKDRVKAITVGLVRDGSVCIFSNVETQEYLEYIESKIVPLVLRREED